MSGGQLALLLGLVAQTAGWLAPTIAPAQTLLWMRVASGGWSLATLGYLAGLAGL